MIVIREKRGSRKEDQEGDSWSELEEGSVHNS